MHFKTVAATLLVAGAAASPYRRQASNETYCDDDELPVPKPTTTKFPPFPQNTTVPGVPSNPGPGGSYPGKPTYPGGDDKPSHPGKPGNGGNYPGKPTYPGGDDKPSHPGKPGGGQWGSYPGKPSKPSDAPSAPTQASTGGDSDNSGNSGSGNNGGSNNGGGNNGNPGSGNNGGSNNGNPEKPSNPGSGNGGNQPSYPGKPSKPTEAPSNGGNQPSYPGKPSNPGNGGSNPGKPSVPGSSSRPWVPYPQNTSIASVTPSFTTIPGVALPTEPVPISTTISAGNNDTASATTSSGAKASATAPATTVPFGTPITKCTVPGDFALTFDDGPFTYTNHVLDLLAEAGAKATFFVNGKNFGDITQFQDVVKRMIADGHQIGSHTFSHPDLATLGDADIIPEMTTLEDALVNIVGKYPTYMRPPFFSWNDNTLSILKALEYHVIHADIDSLDYANKEPLGNLTSVGLFEAGVDAGGSIALAHEVHQNTAEYLVPEFLRIIKEKGLRAVTVGECLGDPEANWYKTKRTSTPTATASRIVVSITSTATPTGVIGPDGACGGTEGYVCEAGACCSEYGFCGTSQAYCGVGCQPLFGVCGAAVPAPAAPSGGDATGTASAPAATQTSGGISPDSSCGGANAYTCPGTTCCSEYGFCGTTTAHCGTGCQPLFGTCS